MGGHGTATRRHRRVVLFRLMRGRGRGNFIDFRNGIPAHSFFFLFPFHVASQRIPFRAAAAGENARGSRSLRFHVVGIDARPNACLLIPRVYDARNYPTARSIFLLASSIGEAGCCFPRDAHTSANKKRGGLSKRARVRATANPTSLGRNFPQICRAAKTDRERACALFAA